MRTVRRTFGTRFRFILIGVLLLVAAAALLRFGGGEVLGWVARPLAGLGTRVTQWFGPQESAQTARQERDRLREQLLQVSQRLATTQRQLEILATVEQLDRFLSEQNIQAITASVIGFSPDPGIQSIVIQRGADDGVAAGQAVITETGIVIGTVVRADASTAVVRLLIDSQSRLLAKVQNEPQSRGMVVGERGISLSMQFIPRNDVIDLGTTVVTSGLDPLIPPDLLIGTVANTQERAGELFKTANLQTPIEFQRLQVVAVVRPRL